MLLLVWILDKNVLAYIQTRSCCRNLEYYGELAEFYVLFTLFICFLFFLKENLDCINNIYLLIYQVLLSLVTACTRSRTVLFTCTDRPASTSSVAQQDRTDGDSLPSDEQLVEQEITGKKVN